MKERREYVCPRCEYRLVPVHAVDGGRRRVIALTCPEPYCDHVQMVPRAEAERLEKILRHRDEDDSQQAMT